MRKCISESTNCPHLRSAKHPCALLGKAFTGKNPQPSCPIKQGFGAGVVLDYEVLNKVDPHPSWQALIEAQMMDKLKNSKHNDFRALKAKKIQLKEAKRHDIKVKA